MPRLREAVDLRKELRRRSDLNEAREARDALEFLRLAEPAKVQSRHCSESTELLAAQEKRTQSTFGSSASRSGVAHELRREKLPLSPSVSPGVPDARAA
jgi:hypothetical protein